MDEKETEQITEILKYLLEIKPSLNVLRHLLFEIGQWLVWKDYIAWSKDLMHTEGENGFQVNLEAFEKMKGEINGKG